MAFAVLGLLSSNLALMLVGLFVFVGAASEERAVLLPLEGMRRERAPEPFLPSDWASGPRSVVPRGRREAAPAAAALA